MYNSEAMKYLCGICGASVRPSLVHLDLREQARLVVDAVRVGPVDDAVPDVGVVEDGRGRRRHDEVGAALAHRVEHAVHLKR